MSPRAVPSRRALRAAATVVAVVLVVIGLFLVVFPWVEGQLENPVMGLADLVAHGH